MPDAEEKMATCPCCGQSTLKKPVKVDSAIVDDYMAGIMTGVPFNHTFDMFNGKLRITVSSATRDEALKLYRFIFITEPFSADSSMVRDLLGLVNTYCSITNIDVSGRNDESRIYRPAEAVMSTCTKLLETWDGENLQEKKTEFLADLQKAYQTLSANDVLSSTPPMILNRVISDFRALETLLLEAGFDENFWKGIELG